MLYWTCTHMPWLMRDSSSVYVCRYLSMRTPNLQKSTGTVSGPRELHILCWNPPPLHSTLPLHPLLLYAVFNSLSSVRLWSKIKWVYQSISDCIKRGLWPSTPTSLSTPQAPQHALPMPHAGKLPGLDNIQRQATSNHSQNSSKVGRHRGLMPLLN